MACRSEKHSEPLTVPLEGWDAKLDPLLGVPIQWNEVLSCFLILYVLSTSTEWIPWFHKTNTLLPAYGKFCRLWQFDMRFSVVTGKRVWQLVSFKAIRQKLPHFQRANTLQYQEDSVNRHKLNIHAEFHGIAVRRPYMKFKFLRRTLTNVQSCQCLIYVKCAQWYFCLMSDFLIREGSESLDLKFALKKVS